MINLCLRRTILGEGDHPEEDCSPLLDDAWHQNYPMMIGMLNLLVCLGRLDISFATSLLSRFTACPLEGHRDIMLRIFGYSKKYKKRRIVIDSRETRSSWEERMLWI